MSMTRAAFRFSLEAPAEPRPSFGTKSVPLLAPAIGKTPATAAKYPGRRGRPSYSCRISCGCFYPSIFRSWAPTAVDGHVRPHRVRTDDDPGSDPPRRMGQLLCFPPSHAAASHRRPRPRHRRLCLLFLVPYRLHQHALEWAGPSGLGPPPRREQAFGGQDGPCRSLGGIKVRVPPSFGYSCIYNLCPSTGRLPRSHARPAGLDALGRHKARKGCSHQAML